MPILIKRDVSIAAFDRSAYDLWLKDNLRHASLIAADSIQHSHDLFLRGEVDVLASLKTQITNGIRHRSTPYDRAPLYRYQTGRWHQKNRPGPFCNFLNDLIATAIQDGFIAASLATHGVADKLSRYRVCSN